MRTFLSVWRLLDRRQRVAFAALQLLAVLMAFSTVGGVAAVLPFFTVLSEPDALHRHPVLLALYERAHFQGERAFVVALGGAFVIAVVLASIINLVGTRAMNRFAWRIGERFHTELFDDYLHRSYTFHVQTNSAQLVSNVIHATTRATAGVLRSGLILIANAVTIACIAGSLIWMNPWIALATLAGFGSCYLAAYHVVQGRLLRNGRSETRAYVARTQVINESFLAIKELIMRQAQRPFVEKFARDCRSISDSIIDTLTISQSPKYILESAAVCTLVGIALYLSRPPHDASGWVAQLSFIGFAAYRLLPAMQEAFAALVRIRADLPAFESIAGDLASARQGAGRRPPLQPAPQMRPHDLLLRDISYTHAPGRPAAVLDVSLHIPPGSVVGLVGANGCGKSTLLDLMVGLLEPQTGRVEVDGIALDERNRPGWQASISYVPQSVALLDATIAENIALGEPVARIDRDRVQAAARLARLDDYVATLPRGYEEPIGERGVRLSGGQRQRLAIARALYREASVLVMDEATSALDMSAERTIVDLLVDRCRRRGATLILVAHRLSALRHCDVIYELAAGRIVRRGVPGQFLTQWDSAVNAS